MPIPSSPEQWAAIEPNETDARLRDAWADKGALGTEAFDQEQLAAASRLLERERVDNEHVERLAASDACPILWSSEGSDERRREWARRILGVE